MVAALLIACGFLLVAVFAVRDFRAFDRRRALEDADEAIYNHDPLFAHEIGITKQLIDYRASLRRARAMMRAM